MIKFINQNKLVIIQLSGGNDGLNTLIPFQNDLYYQLRPKISKKKESTIIVNDHLGFNSTMDFFHRLYHEGHLTIVNNVGYPNPRRSHFHSMDVWQSGLLDQRTNTSGWLGRYLDLVGPHFKTKIGAIAVGNTICKALEGKSYKGVVIDDVIQMRNHLNTDQYKTLLSRIPQLEKTQEPNLAHIYNIIADGLEGLDDIYHKLHHHKPQTQFSKDKLNKELKLVADLIISEAETQIYYVSHGSFDTHVNQEKLHDKLLNILNEGVKEFINNLEKYNKMDNVSILIFSEFGRRVQENKNQGTDHGAANSVYIISKNLTKGGLYNPYHSLDNLENGDIPYEIDFREIYASILEDWLEIPSKTILLDSFQKIPLFSKSYV